MPRVALTEAQRQEQRCRDRSRALADGLAVYRNAEHMTLCGLMDATGLGEKAVSKLLSGEDLRLSVFQFWRLLDLAGLKIVKRQEVREL